MSELKPNEPGLRGVRRIIGEWICHASASLSKKQVTDADIHDARKQLKKSRAALRLLRDAIGATTFERDNAALRDAARPLSAARDSKVLLSVLDELVDRYGLADRKQWLEKFRRELRKEQRQARQVLTAAQMARQRKALHEIVQRSNRWRMHGEDWQVLGVGLERIYRNGRKKLKVATASRDSEHLHDWRKQVKYLWHELQILQPLWPGVIGELADQTHKLSDYLGDDHDLAVLRDKITGNAAAFAENDCGALLALLDRRRRQLQDKALVLGERIFAAKPGEFSRPFTGYWQAWRRSAPE
jgi:CHAD domain-containing protein